MALRVNPDVEADTHAYISTGRLAHKFGVDIGEAEAVYERARRHENLLLEGVSCHIGSQLMNPQPVMEAVGSRAGAGGEAARQGLRHPPRRFRRRPGSAIQARRRRSRDRRIRRGSARARRGDQRIARDASSPGRSIVGAAGVLLTRVLYRKNTGGKEFVIVDAAMTDLIRPALYDAHHEILPLRESGRAKMVADVVGPVCETGDFLARSRELAEVFPGDVLAVCTAGAYGFVQASTYNARPRVAEVLVENGAWRVVRKRETYEDLIRGEE